jgi:phthalate 4,5-cis-dihydrodiol dehydrogenase
MAEKLRICMLGVGDAAGGFLEALPYLRNKFILHSVVCRTESKAQEYKEKYGAQTYYLSVDEGIGDPECDVVINNLPTPLHRSVTEESARLGKHVLVEKPMAENAQDARAMIRICHEAGVTLQVGQICRFMPAHIGARELIRRGEIGQPLHVTVHFLSLTTPQWVPSWHNKELAQGGYLLSHSGSHTIDLTLWLLDDRPSRVYCEAASNNPAYPGEDDYSLLAWFDSGVIYSDIHSANARVNIFDQRIIGSEGTLTITNYANLYLNTQRVDCSAWGAPPLGAGQPDLLITDFRTWRWVAYKRQLEEFYDAIVEGQAPSSSGESVLSSIEVIDAGIRSALTHQVQWMDYRGVECL